MQVVSRGVSETWLPCTWKVVTVNNQVRPDISLIVLDTLRADRLSCYGYERDTCPHPDAFTEQGVLDCFTLNLIHR
jgi:glucan phosphoethanolaminetransferase (alkaline phosphatase superfamily)